MPPNIVGVNLDGIDQIRKRLSSLRKDAFASGNGADGRATRAVLDAFDDHIDRAVNGGMFEGDPRAIDAWNKARAAYADYRKTFTAGKNDPVGRVVERIIGKDNNPAAIPNDVADFIYGSAGVNPTSLNVGVTNRLKTMLGDRSPEWSAIKQGLFSRLVESGQGMTEMGAGNVAQRLNRFLNVDGKEMAALLFSKYDRDLLQKYADLMRHLEVPQAGANWSNTATFAAEGFRPSASARIFDAIGSNVGAMVGAVLGHVATGGLGGEAVGAATAKAAGWARQQREAAQIAKRMPIIKNVVRDYQVAADAAEASRTPRTIARLTIAARNLSSNLKSINVSISPDDILRATQGPIETPADQFKGDRINVTVPRRPLTYEKPMAPTMNITNP